MLAEVRALNEAIIIADQLPKAMAPEVIKNTSLKTEHRITSIDDRGLLGNTMSAYDVQLERMATFSQGKALVVYEGLLKPFELQMHQWSRIGDFVDDNLYTSPNDLELYERLSYEGSPFIDDMEKSFKITKAKFDAKWHELSKAVNEFNKLLYELSLNPRFERINSFCQERKSDDWSKASDDERNNYLAKMNKMLDKMQKPIDSQKQNYYNLCNIVEEIILALYAYRKQNSHFEKEIHKDFTMKVKSFTKICVDVEKEYGKYGLVRTPEQKARLIRLLKQWE